MGPTLVDLLEGAEHEQVQVLQDPEIGCLALVAIHSTRHGPAFGGVRRFAYRSTADALRDVLRLSAAMTWKCMMARIAGGGGKCVLVEQPHLDVPAAYRLLGRFVENMGGRYYTGPDVGTGPAELEHLAAATRFVTAPGPRGPGDLSAATAQGVVAGLRAVARWLGREGGRDLGAMHFAIQGVGGVGFDVARRLRAVGARVTAADEDSERIARARDELGVESVSPGRIYDVACDVFVPCAMGGILHDLTIERLRCQAVAGSANNILAAPRHARSLAERGILVAPDFVINSGALILGANVHLTGVRDQSAAIDRIESELLELFERAARVEITPFELTEHIARERLMAPSRHGRFYFPHEEQA